jgi:hypothetical protein
MPHKIPTIVWLMVFLLCALPVLAQKSQKRVALVIGNNYYDTPSALTNQNTDAFDVAEALTELGFEVLRGFNLNKQQTENLIETFGKRLSKTGRTGLFYYAGMGFNANGENFLVPNDASFKNKGEILKTSISLKTLFSQINAKKNLLNLILLDAAQTNPNAPTLYKEPGNETGYTGYGFTQITPPKDTIIFYSAANRRTALKRCGRNGYFAAKLLNALRKGSLEFRQMATNISEEIKQKTYNLQQPYFDGTLRKRLYLVDNKNKLKPKKTPLEVLFASYKELKKCECGNKDGTISLGKEIIEKYQKDELNVDVIEFIKKDLAKIEKDEPICRRNNRYDFSYKTKNWGEFYAVSKEIIEQDNDQGLVLDVMLTLVSVGYNRATVDKIDTYNTDTLYFAKKAIQQIESGTKSKTGKLGVFEPFNNKGNALSWMNYIIGWEMYDKMNQKNIDSLSYLYKSTQTGNEKKNDISIYVKIGNYYFDEALRLDGEYRKKLSANNNEDNDETKSLLALARGTTDRAIDAFGRAYKIAVNSKLKTNAIDAIKKNLDDFYRFRFNLQPEVKPEGVEIYVEKLISQPMPDPTTKVEPVLN